MYVHIYVQQKLRPSRKPNLTQIPASTIFQILGSIILSPKVKGCLTKQIFYTCIPVTMKHYKVNLKDLARHYDY